MQSASDARALVAADVQPLLPFGKTPEEFKEPAAGLRQCRVKRGPTAGFWTSVARVVAVGVPTVTLILLVPHLLAGATTARRTEPRGPRDAVPKDADWDQRIASFAARRDAKMPAPSFQKSSKGCLGEGLAPIHRLADCRHAATALGLEHSVVHKTSSGDTPEGCSYHARSANSSAWIGLNTRRASSTVETNSFTVGHFSLCATRGSSPNGELGPGAANVTGASGDGPATNDPIGAPLPRRDTDTTTTTSTATSPKSSTMTTTATTPTTTTITTTTTLPFPTETFYMYRAQSDADYPMENVNTADVAGVLWYLHNEVVWMCPRKYAVTRILRLKVTVKQPMMPYVAFDSGKCTVPNCEQQMLQSNYAVGWQVVAYGANLGIGQQGIEGRWYSLPGPCPSAERGQKSPACMADEPGGACKKGVWDDRCTYSVEFSGDIRLNELTGIQNYSEFCEAGNLEYDVQADKGVNFGFWDGKFDLQRCRQRCDAVLRAFELKYPDQPSHLRSRP